MIVDLIQGLVWLNYYRAVTVTISQTNGGCLVERDADGFEFHRWSFMEVTVNNGVDAPTTIKWWSAARRRSEFYVLENRIIASLKRKYKPGRFNPALYS